MVVVVTFCIHGMEMEEVYHIPQATGIDKILRNNSAQTLDTFLSALTSREREACLAGINESSQADKENAYNEPLLHRAVRYHRLSLLEVILKHGADINGTNSVGQTALHVACEPSISEKDKVTKIALWLIQHGINCSQPDNTLQTPLHRVAGARNKEILEALIGQNVDPNAQNQAGQTPLHLAVLRGHYDDDLFKTFNTVARGIIYNAADESRVIAQILVHNGALIDLQDVDKFTSLHYAIYSCDMKMTRLLVSLDASCTLPDPTGVTPSMLLRELYETARKEIKEYNIKGSVINFIRISAPIDRVHALISAIEWFDGMTLNEDSETVLHLLAEVGASKQVRLLVKRGVPIEIQDGTGQTALHRAAKNGHAQVVATLLKKTEDIIVDKAGNSALHSAIKSKQYMIAKQLIDAMPSMLTLVNKKGSAPIDMLRANLIAIADEISVEDHYIRDAALELSLLAQSMVKGAAYLLDILAIYGTE